MSNSKNGVYFPNLNGVRFIAALSVLIYHFFNTTVLNGHLGVILFYVLSGFLITFLLCEEKENHKSVAIKKFYIRRILRIWPLYFFIVLIASIFFLVSKGYGSSNSTSFNSLIFYLVFIPNVAFVLNIGFKYATILWSVGSEEQFYLLWPWLIRIKNNKRIILIFILIIMFFTLVPHVIDYLNNKYFENSKNVLYYSSRTILRMSFSSMATGGLLAFLYKYHYKYVKILFNKVVQIICLIVLLFCWILNVSFLFNDQVYATLFGIIIFNLAVNPEVIFSLENKLFDYLGKISYGLYVYHLIAFDLNKYIITRWLKLPFSANILLFSIGLLTTVLLASLSYYLFEKPFLKMKSLKFSLIRSGNLFRTSE